MTTLRTMRRRLKRMILCGLLVATGSTFTTSSSATAQETHDSDALCGWIDDLDEVVCTKPQTDTQDRSASPQFIAVTAGDELKINTCNYDAWLAQVLDAQPATAQTVRTSLPRTASEFQTRVSEVAPDATSGVVIDQCAEPFVLVGSEVCHLPIQIKAFESWFQAGTPTTAYSQSAWPRNFVPVVDFGGEIAIEDRDGMVLIETTPKPATEAVDPLVGGSPIIATIKEAYLPYDLADRDRNDFDADGPSKIDIQPSMRPPLEVESDNTPQVVWVDGLFSPMAQPFCIRSLVESTEANWGPLQVTKSDENSLVRSDPPTINPPLDGVADCLLDEFVWQINVTLEDYRVTQWKLHPERIGQQVASLVVSGERFVSNVANELALVWPAPKQPVEPQVPGIGTLLLARAQAVERLDAEQVAVDGSAEPISPEQLAQARASILQWVAVAQSVIDDVSQRLTVVPEVARTRGTQDESTRR